MDLNEKAKKQMNFLREITEKTGLKDKVELEHPENGQEIRFTMNHRFVFDLADGTRIVLECYSGDDIHARDLGVFVLLPDGKGRNLPCQSEYFSKDEPEIEKRILGFLNVSVAYMSDKQVPELAKLLNRTHMYKDRLGSKGESSEDR